MIVKSIAFYAINFQFLFPDNNTISSWSCRVNLSSRKHPCKTWRWWGRSLSRDGYCLEVSACYFACIISSFCIFIDDFLHSWNCYWPQEKQWVFSRCLHLLRRDKVCLRRIFRHIFLPCSTKVHIETTWACSCWLHYRHHQHGSWQSRIGGVAGNKDLYLVTFSKRDFYLTVGFVFWIDKYVVSRAFWRKGTCRPASCLLLRTNVGFEIYSSEKSMHSRLEKGVLKWTWDSM